jgi:hypothetical protein
MRRAARVLFLTLALASTAGAALAESGLSVGLNQSRRVVLHGAAASVIVSDPHVADVAMVDAHDMILLGRGYGATDVIVLDRAGRTLLDARVSVSAPETGRVTIHRGAMAAEFACSPRCQSLTPPGGSAAGDQQGSSAAAPPTTNGATSPPVATPGT